MNISSYATIAGAALVVAVASAIGCGSDNAPIAPVNGGSGTTGNGAAGGTPGATGSASDAAAASGGATGTATGGSAASGAPSGASGASASAASGTGATGSTASGATGSTASGATGSTASGATAGSTAASGATADAGVGICASTLVDKQTACTAGTDFPCAKGCGPLLPTGAAQKNLGNKTCSCSGAVQPNVYTCGACVYESPLPGCFIAATPTPACGAGVADKVACTNPCTGNGTGNDVCQIVTDAGKTDGCVCISGASGPVWTCATLPW